MNYTFNYIIGGTLLRRQVVHFYSGLDIKTCGNSIVNEDEDDKKWKKFRLEQFNLGRKIFLN